VNETIGEANKENNEWKQKKIDDSVVSCSNKNCHLSVLLSFFFFVRTHHICFLSVVVVRNG